MISVLSILLSPHRATRDSVSFILHGIWFENVPYFLTLSVYLVPHYSVDVQSVEDIQAAVNFASEKDLYLVVKNTGHSQ